MARPPAEHYELSETEKRDLIKLIEMGKPLPEKYHFIYVDQESFEKHKPQSLADLTNSFTEYQS